MYLCSDIDIGGVVSMSKAEAIAFMRSRGKKVEFLTGVKGD